ncbi:MAG: adenylosuccinate synthetase, partial [Chloroflexi bacterium]|nr:adenylosuccinate synthetase [Chloroflexota bacterium]
TEITSGGDMEMLREGLGGAAGTAEYGTTTGRARRVGWFDSVLARYTARSNGVTSIALTRLDSLSAFESIKICVAYEVGDQRVTTLPATLKDAARAKPIFEELPGWQQDVTHARHIGDLPTEARQYVGRIEELMGVPVDMISVGPERHQAIVTRDIFGASI